MRRSATFAIRKRGRRAAVHVELGRVARWDAGESPHEVQGRHHPQRDAAVIGDHEVPEAALGEAARGALDRLARSDRHGGRRDAHGLAVRGEVAERYEADDAVGGVEDGGAAHTEAQELLPHDLGAVVAVHIEELRAHDVADGGAHAGATCKAVAIVGGGRGAQLERLVLGQVAVRILLFIAGVQRRRCARSRPMGTFHVAVWIDHHEAKVFHVEEDSFTEATLRAPKHHVHKHPKGIAWEKSHPADVVKYFHGVAEALADATEILIVGPGSAKLELMRHIHSHHPALEKKIAGIETADHPTDGQIVKHARAYFNAADRMQGLRP